MPAGYRAPPPAYQAATQGSRYGFRSADPGMQQGRDDIARHGEAAGPMSHGGFVTPQTRGGFVTPVSHGGSAAPSARGGSTSRGGSVAPSSRGGSVAPSSRGGSVAPSPRSASVVPTSRSTSSGIVSSFCNGLTAVGVPPGSQGYTLPQVPLTTCNVAAQSWIFPDTPISPQIDYEQESQVPNHWYYDPAPANNFGFESTQSQQPRGDIVSLHYISPLN